MRSLEAGHEFACVGIFRNLAAGLHQVLGNYDWLESSEGDVPPLSDLDSSSASHSDSALPSGVILTLGKEPVLFDPRKLHKTMPWKGRRTVLIAFTPSAVPGLSREDVEQLLDLGFVLPPGMAGDVDPATEGVEKGMRGS